MHIAWPVLLKICLLLAVATLLILFAAAFAGLAWMAWGGRPAEHWLPALAPIAYLGAVGTLFCYFVSVWAQQFVRPITVVLVFSLESVFAALFGWLCAGETLGWREGAGAALIFAGALGHGLWTARTQRPSAPPAGNAQSASTGS